MRLQTGTGAFSGVSYCDLRWTDGKLAGVIAVADTVKPTSAAAIAELKALGLRVVMITGDNQRTATAIGREVGVDQGGS